MNDFDENLGCAWPSLAANAATVALAVADALWQRKNALDGFQCVMVRGGDCKDYEEMHVMK